MIVAKFGGSTLAGSKSLKGLIDIVRTRYTGSRIAIVCSAFKGVTDILVKAAYSKDMRTRKSEVERVISIHKKILSHYGIRTDCISDLIDRLRAESSAIYAEFSPERLDNLSSFGERLSAVILSRILTNNGIESVALEPRDISLFTDSNHGNALPLPESDALVKESLLRISRVPVITGFIGITKDGKTTTLGRNGSDFSAAYIGACVNASEVHFWKDVSAIYDAHPGYIKSPKRVTAITYDQLELLSFFGSKIIQPSTLLPLKKKNIPAMVLNCQNPSDAGTAIRSSLSQQDKRFLMSIEKDVVRVTARSQMPAFRHVKSEMVRRLYQLSTSVYIVKNLVSSISFICKNDPRLSGFFDQFEGVEVEHESGLDLIAIAGCADYSGAIQKMSSLYGEIRDIYIESAGELIFAVLPKGSSLAHLEELYSYLSEKAGAAKIS